MSFYGLLQLANVLDTHQGSRLDATLGNSAYLAVYMLIHIFLSMFFFGRSEKNSLMRWFYGGAVALQTIILYNTATRGALLGLIAGLIVSSLFVIFFERENKKLRKFCIGSLTALVILVGTFIGIKNTQFVQDSPVLKRFADISLEEGTTKARLMVWSMAAQGFKENPILGWGQGNFNYVFNKYYDPGMYTQEQWFDRTHNVFFDWLIAGGLLGILGYLSLFAVLIFYIFIDRKNNFTVVEKSIFIGMLTAYFVHNFFVFDHLISYILFFSILGYFHHLNKEKKIFSENVNTDINRIAIPVVVVLVLFSVYVVNIKPILANYNLLSALIPHEEGVEKNLKYFEKAVSYETFGNQEIREQICQMVNKAAGVNLDQSIKNKILNLAVSEMEKQIKVDPENARLEFILGVAIAGAGVYDDSLVHMKRALELSPTKQSIMSVLATIYNSKGEYAKGFEYAKKAFELDESFDDLRILYASGAIYLGEDELAEELLVPKFKTTLVDDNRIIQAYFTTKQYQKVVSILEKHIENKPNDLQSRLSLASTYIELGQRAKAIALIQEVINLNPDFKDQGEYYIQQINLGNRP